LEIVTKLKSDLEDIRWRQHFIRNFNEEGLAPPMKEYHENMKAKEVAEYIIVGEKTIRNWTNEGKIPFVKLSNAVRYPKTHIDNWLKAKEH